MSQLLMLQPTLAHILVLVAGCTTATLDQHTPGACRTLLGASTVQAFWPVLPGPACLQRGPLPAQALPALATRDAACKLTVSSAAVLLSLALCRLLMASGAWPCWRVQDVQLAHWFFYASHDKCNTLFCRSGLPTPRQPASPRFRCTGRSRSSCR